MNRWLLNMMLAGSFLPLSAGLHAQVKTASPAPADTRLMAAMKAKPAVKAALAALEAEHDQWVDNIVTLTQIPAPPFKEEVRAKAYADMFRAAGLADVEIDETGNVLGLMRGTGKSGASWSSCPPISTRFSPKAPMSPFAAKAQSCTRPGSETTCPASPRNSA